MENEQIHKRLTILLGEYIKAIVLDYGKYIPKERLETLQTIDYNKVIQIYDTHTINGACGNENIHLPSGVNEIFQMLSKLPEYGTIKNHKIFDDDTIIDNDNTFWDYVRHLILSGSTIEDYYDDLLLHETVHFCGSDGGFALKEGLTEMLTRKIAKKYGFRTNACGYSKEVKIVNKLQKMFGEETINKITFMSSMRDITNHFKENFGEEEANLFSNIVSAMQQEYNLKYAQHNYTFKGMEGVREKCYYYSQIDYSIAYELIQEYQKNKKEKKLDSI